MIEAPEEWGHSRTSGATPVTAEPGWDSRSIPMPTVATTEPAVNISVKGGSSAPLLVNTGPRGMVVQLKDIGGVPGLLRMDLPTGSTSAATAAADLPVRHLPDHRGLRIRPSPPHRGHVVLLSVPTSQYAISAYVFNSLKDPFTSPFDA